MQPDARSAATKRRKAKRTPKRATELGISDEEYARLLTEQEGGCAICGNQPKRLKKDGTTYRFMVDHNHRTGKVRGLLCFRCNRGLPTYATSEWLRSAYGYVLRDEYPDLDVPDQWLAPLDQWADAR
jgi:hypothetical protein